jgi:signal transduction histidine kinase
MIRSLRLKLTLLYLVSFLLFYGLGGAAGLAVFYSGLSVILDEEIADLRSQIVPVMEFKDELPSLKNWAGKMKQAQLDFPAGVQIFDTDRRLLETYGLTGNSLARGEFVVSNAGQQSRLRSTYETLKKDGKQRGYLQIQMETCTRDDAVKQCALAMLLILPFLLIAVALAGYFFSGQAIKPVEKSIKVLQTFVADAGHEFITPVTVVEASLQTLEATLRDRGLGTEILSIIARASSRMKELASDLIFLAKFEDPSSKMSMEVLSVEAFVEPALKHVMEIARSKGVELTCSSIPDLHVNGSLPALQMMVSNLVSNAIKFTEPGGKVQVGVSQEGHRIAIAVEDTGIGIPESCLEQIFDRFYRVDKSRSRSQGGSGLGLAIVKAILEAHKAQIDVQSTPGKGSKFTVRMQRTA